MCTCATATEIAVKKDMRGILRFKAIGGVTAGMGEGEFFAAGADDSGRSLVGQIHIQPSFTSDLPIEGHRDMSGIKLGLQTSNDPLMACTDSQVPCITRWTQNFVHRILSPQITALCTAVPNSKCEANQVWPDHIIEDRVIAADVESEVPVWLKQGGKAGN